MLERLRPAQTVVLMPVARALVRAKVHPDTVTWAGTGAVVVVALLCFPRGWLWQGALALAFVLVSDMLDGHMARLTRRSDRWGAFLDSTLDRVADAAVFGGLLFYFLARGELIWVGVTVLALAAAEITSYARARAEALGWEAQNGLVTRADRLALALTGALLTGLGVPGALHIAMAALAVLGVVTVAQRMLAVRRQAHPDVPHG